MLNSSSSTDYLLVKFGGGTHRVELPFEVGSSLRAKVVVAERKISPLHWSVSGKDGEVFVDYLGDERALPFDSYEIFAGKPPRFSWLSISEILYFEESFGQMLPHFLRVALGFFLPQKIRISCWIFFLVAVLCGVFFYLQESEKIQDRSREVVRLNYDQTFTTTLGSVDGYRDFARGITYGVILPEEVRDKKLILKFQHRGIEDEEELCLYIDGIKALSVPANPECFFQFCDHEVIFLPKGGSSEFRFAHKPESSDYALKNIRVFARVPITFAERKFIEQQISQVKRYYEEQFVDAANLRQALKMLSQINRLLERRVDDANEQSQVDFWRNKTLNSRDKLLESTKAKYERLRALGDFYGASLELSLILNDLVAKDSDLYRHYKSLYDEINLILGLSSE